MANIENYIKGLLSDVGLLDYARKAGQNIVSFDETMNRGVRGLLDAQSMPASDNFESSRLNYLTDFLVEREGFIPEAKVPTKGDVLTIGYGRTEGVKPGDKIDKETGKVYLKEDIMKRLPEVERAIPGLSNYPLEIQGPLVSEWFRGSLVQSPKTRKLIKAGKFEEASKEFLNNDEYKNAKKRGRSGIRGRMEETALAIRNMGQFNGQ